MAYPPLTKNLHHEIELVVAIGRAARNIAGRARPLEHIWGYAVGLDMTRRDLQGEMKKQGRPWGIGKGFDAVGADRADPPGGQDRRTDEAARSRSSVNGETAPDRRPVAS